MTKVSMTTRIPVSPEKIWDLIGQFNALQRPLGHLPTGGVPDCLLRPGAEIRLELVESEISQPVDDELEMHRQLVLDLILGAEGVGVVHGQPAYSQQAMDSTRHLVAIDPTQL